MWGFIKAVIGIGKADPQIIQSRRIICNKCDKKIGSSCDICGCLIFLKTKLRDEECPLLKW